MPKRRTHRRKRASVPRGHKTFSFRGRKRPKRPKMGAGINSWRRYDEKITRWEHEMSEKEHLLKKHGLNG
jgi:hypothetical protein